MKTKVYIFEVRELMSREAEVTASSLREARALLHEWQSGAGRAALADMGGTAPIQLSDMETLKVTCRHIDSLTRYEL